MSIPSWLMSIPKEKPQIDYDKITFDGKPDFWNALSKFEYFNQEKHHDTDWNTNDILFIQWIIQMFPGKRIDEISDVRARIGLISCNHGHLIGGENFITLEEKEIILKKEFDIKLRRGDYNTPMKNPVIPEENEFMGDAIIRSWRLDKIKIAEEQHKLLVKEHERDLLTRLRNKSFIIDFTLENLMWQVSSMISNYWLNYNENDNIINCIPSQYLLNDINYLGNKSLGIQQGSYLSFSLNNWLPFVTHSITHLYLEYCLLEKWPIYDINININSINKFNIWVKERFSRDIPHEICKQVREEVCSIHMPAGARTYCRRILNRTSITEDVICQQTIGTNATAEILACIDDELKIKQISYEPTHLLYDSIASCAVAWHCQELIGNDMINHGLDYDTEVILSNSDLIDCYKTLFKETIYGKKRCPLICNIKGWKVHYDNKWYNTKTYTNSWILWLKLVLDNHEGKTTHNCDISEWQLILDL
jgi:hypothetical protein